MGTGLGRKGASVRWSTAGRIGLGWLITIPSAGLVGAGAALLALIGPIGILLDVVLAGIAILSIFLISRSTRVDHRTLDTPEPGEFVRPKVRKKARSQGGAEDGR
jgi:PiT family inorganic phosphate transporter